MKLWPGRSLPLCPFHVISPCSLDLISLLLPCAALAFALHSSVTSSTLARPARLPPVAVVENTQVSYQQLTEIALFMPAARIVESDAESRDEHLQQSPESALPIKVTGVLSSGSSALSMAILQQGQQQVTLGMGDTLPATTATIVRIFPDRVIIRYQGRYEALTMK